MKTIFALASGHGKAGVAVVRVSGPKAFDVAKHMLKDQKLPEPRHASYAKLYDEHGDVIDHALVLLFKGPHSFTGEDVAEFHIHGSIAVLNDLSAFLAGAGGCVLAEPGEFTRRAFLNGKFDLTEVEGLADLISAETNMQKRLALKQMEGSLKHLYEDWHQRLLKILAYTEAEIDFADDDVPQDLIEKSRLIIQKLISEIETHLAEGHKGERVRNGIRIALIGAPNAGKSTLLNALAQRDVAIVSDEAGTTRDILEVHLDLKGLPVIIADTAGLRETTGKIEREGIRRAEAWAEDADIRLMLIDAEKPVFDKGLQKFVDEKTFFILNKIDLAPDAFFNQQPLYKVSAQKGEGLDQLLKDLETLVVKDFALPESAPLTRLRHRHALEEAASHLKRSFHVDLPELVAEDYRLAMRAISCIMGKTDVEDLLDVIFKDFCIGK